MTPPSRDKYGVILLGALLMLFSVLLIWNQWTAVPLWSDEAGLALNIVPRKMAEMGRPFVYYQVCPHGFLVLVKLATWVLGTGERVLRLLPVLGGLTTLFAVAVFSFRAFGIRTAVVAVGLSGSSFRLVEYSAEFKPYATDAAVAIGLGLLALLVFEVEVWSRQAGRRLAALAVAGVLAVWLSLPSIFILGGVGVALCLDPKFRPGMRRPFGYLLLCGGLWLGAFVAGYLLLFSVSSGDSGLNTFWDGAFAPFPITSMEDARWYVGRFFFVFSDPGGFRPRHVAGVLWVVGCVAIYRRDKRIVALLLFPLVLVLIASAMKKYPFHGRLLLFLMPGALVTLAVPIAAMVGHRRREFRVVAGLLLCGFVWSPVQKTAAVLSTSREGAYMRDGVRFMAGQWRSGDRLYLEQATHWIYDYYAYEAGFKTEPIYGQERSQIVKLDGTKGTNWALDLAELDQLRGQPRVWLVMSTFRWPGGESREDFFLAHLDRIGHRLDFFPAEDVNFYLYDLQGTRTSTLPLL